MSELSVNHRESSPKIFQCVLQITKNCPKEISEWFAIHRESPQRNFRVVPKSLRITPKKFQSSLQITENHPWETLEWFENHWELPPKKFQSCLANHQRITANPPKKFQTGLQITKNHSKEISEWFANHLQEISPDLCESPRIIPKEISEIFANHWKLSRITPKNHPKEIVHFFTENHWELPKRNFQSFFCESTENCLKEISEWLQITKNHWELPPKKFQSGLQITQNCTEEMPEWFANYQESPQRN